jgi:CheY-like chemotaxis protein
VSYKRLFSRGRRAFIAILCYIQSEMNLNDRLQGVRILAIDDDKDTREMLRFILEQQAAKVVAVESVNEAVDSLQNSPPPDLILSDIAMPDYNGYAFIAILRENDKKLGRVTPAIALTAYTSPADEETALAAGFQKYMSKPFEPAELIEAIRSLVNT